GAGEDIQVVLQLHDVDDFRRGRRLRRHRCGPRSQQRTQQDDAFHVSSSNGKHDFTPNSRAPRRLVVASGATVESKSLNLWKQQLGTLPASLWDNTALETLILADNALAELPEDIA